METKNVSTAIQDMKHDGVIQVPSGALIFGPSHLILRVSHGLGMNKPLANIIDRVDLIQPRTRGEQR